MIQHHTTLCAEFGLPLRLTDGLCCHICDHGTRHFCIGSLEIERRLEYEASLIVASAAGNHTIKQQDDGPDDSRHEACRLSLVVEP
jgi:hypothetical protein